MADLVIIEPLPQGLDKIINEVVAAPAEGLPIIELATFKEAAEAARLLSQSTAALAVCYALDARRAVGLLALMKILSHLIKTEHVRFLVFLPYKDEVYEKKFKQYGASEVLVGTHSERAYKFQLQKWLHFKHEVPTPGETPSGSSPFRLQDLRVSPGHPGSYHLVDSLTLESDCWLLYGKKPKHVMGKWIIELLGPGPETGRWTKVAENDWAWIPDPSKDTFIKEAGTWRVTGSKPEFRDKRWTFIGEFPKLGFFNGADALGYKFYADSETIDLKIARDSRSAIAALPKLTTEYEAVIVQEARPESPELIFREPKQEIKNTRNDLMLEKSNTLQLHEKQVMGASYWERIQRKIQEKHGNISEGQVSILKSSNEAYEKTKVRIKDDQVILEGKGKIRFEESELRAKSPTTPTLGPLTFAFLVSELIQKKDIDLAERVKKFCIILSESIGGLGVEVWKYQNDWNCIGSVKGDPLKHLSENKSEFDSIVGQNNEPDSPRTINKLINDQLFICRVSDVRGDQIIGALLINGAGAKEVAPKYLLEVGEATRGILLP